MLKEADKKKIQSIFQNLVESDEFEFMFNNYRKDNPLSISKYIYVLKYLSSRSKREKLKVIEEDTLDISYRYDQASNNTYRISISGMDKINSLMNMLHNRKNHIIFSILISRMQVESDETVTIIKKEKDMKKTFNIDEHDLRVRLSKELKLKKKEMDELLKINEEERRNITFRFKQRTSLILIDDKKATVRVDLTHTKMSNNINNIEDAQPIYELEIEFVRKSKLSKKESDNYLKLMYEEIEKIKNVLQQSSFVISNEEKEAVMTEYKKLVYGDENIKIKSPYLMQPESVEIQHIVDKIPNRYSITDKADGDRYSLLIFKDKVYLVSTGLDMKYSGIQLKSTQKKYNGTILDGEYVYIPEKNKFLYLAFDVLFYQGKNIMDMPLLKERMQYLDDVINNCFNVKYKYTEYSGKFDLEKISKHHSAEIDKHLADINGSLETGKDINIIKRKYFIFPYGGNNCEIFTYSKLMWDKYTIDETSQSPYRLDGLIYTSIEQKYTRIQKQIKNKTFKWKPSDYNSVDMYVVFERNRETGQVIDAFDNADDNEINDKIYRICNLYVGKVIKGVEHPILFQKNKNNHIAHLYLQDGEVRDVEGNIIQDKTVVEFVYDVNADVPKFHSWIPLRTRYDKTESVIKYRRKYGNSFAVADRVWNSIQNQFSVRDMGILGNPDTYDGHMKTLKGRVSVEVITRERKQNAYYQLITNLAKPLRQFHNWIKSNIIYMYCSQKNIGTKKVKLKVLDVGCGRGGDIQKFYHARVKDGYVGLDPDYNNIHSATDGAISRYNTQKTRFPGYPKMNFVLADAGILLNYTDQVKTFSSMTPKNRNILSNFFGTTDDTRPEEKFDVFNCQFMIHYLFKDDTTWNNFCQNVNRYLDNDGYLLITTFDGAILDKTFDQNGKISSYYTTDEGDKVLFFEAIKRYDTKNLKKTGLAVDIHIKIFMEEDTYQTEYLVDKDFMIKELKEKCQMELVETELFENVYNNYKDFFENAVPFEEDARTRGFFMKVKEFYNMNDSVNRASFDMTKLNRYYIFRKKHDAKTALNPRSGPKRKKQKGGDKSNVMVI